MTTETAPTKHTSTWIDWMPPGAPTGAVLSHDELLAELRDQGIDLAAATLEHWRRNGVLPRPVRRRHDGATRPVYPSWFVPAIKHLRDLQRAGRSLEEIAPVMRSWALSTVLWNVPDPVADAIAEIGAILLTHARTIDPGVATIELAFFNEDGGETFTQVIPIPPRDHPSR